MSDDIIAQLEAELSGLSDAARLPSLTRLGQALADRYWRTGPGTPGSVVPLNGAIAALDEAHGYMRDDDGLRGTVAGQLGWLLGARCTLHAGDARDRDKAFRMLEEALGSSALPAIMTTMCRVQLGQLSLNEVTTGLQSGGSLMEMVHGHAPPDAVKHADRAVTCFREVLAGPAVSAEITDTVQPLLTLAETVRMMVSGTGAAGLDMQRLMQVMTQMQTLRSRFAPGMAAAGGLQGTPSFLSFQDFQNIAGMNPVDRPVAAVQSVSPVVEGEAVQAPPRPTPPPADRNELRRSLHEKLAGAAGPEPIWKAAAAQLLPGAPPPSIEVVDEIVALAEMVVDLPVDEDGTMAEDHFTLATALYLRDRADEGGDHADLLAGAQSLRTAVRTVPLDHPATTTMLRALGAFLDEDRPLSGVAEVMGEDFADRLDSALAAGVTSDAADVATLHALRCLCRAAGVMAELGRAPVPSDYPWHVALKAATRLAG